MITNNDSVANRIKKGMQIRNMKQSDIVRITGINKGSLSSYITGRYLPKQDNIYRIAKALDVNEAWLMGISDDIKRVPDEERGRQKSELYPSNKKPIINASLNDLKEVLDKELYSLIDLTLNLSEESQKELLKRARELEVLELHKNS